MANDPEALLARYLADFPQEHAQLEIVEIGDGLQVRHREAGVIAEEVALSVDSAEETYWGGWRAEIAEGDVRKVAWLYPYEGRLLMAWRITNEGDLPCAMPDGFAREATACDEGWVLGGTLEGHGPLAPGASTTMRAIMRIARGTVQDVLELLAEDEAEWTRSGPYEIPGRSHTAEVLQRRETP